MLNTRNKYYSFDYIIKFLKNRYIIKYKLNNQNLYLNNYILSIILIKQFLSKNNINKKKIISLKTILLFLYTIKYSHSYNLYKFLKIELILINKLIMFKNNNSV